MRTVGIVQARLGSSRLPGKVLLPIGGRPMIDVVVSRLRRAHRLDDVVVATGAGHLDDEVAAWCDRAAVPCVRGSEDDVLARFALAARTHDADVVVRITADCPLVDPDVVDLAVDHLIGDEADYVLIGNDTGLPLGVNAEVIRRWALDEAAASATAPFEREHVTPYVRDRRDRFVLRSIEAPPELRRPGYRLTVDEQADLDLVRSLVGELDVDPVQLDIASVVALLDRRPDLVAVNRTIVQRSGREANPSGRG